VLNTNEQSIEARGASILNRRLTWGSGGGRAVASPTQLEGGGETIFRWGKIFIFSNFDDLLSCKITHNLTLWYHHYLLIFEKENNTKANAKTELKIRNNLVFLI